MLHILIADPDVASRKALALLLFRRLGVLGIREAGDVETLVQAFSEAPCDLLLLDWRLHGTLTLEACRLLHKTYPALKIALLSVNADDEKATCSVGAIFIYKGAPPDRVVAALESLLKADS
jgi:DNA-binding NarL/FixJ family response regulator